MTLRTVIPPPASLVSLVLILPANPVQPALALPPTPLPFQT